jgi:hypothetical protein
MADREEFYSLLAIRDPPHPLFRSPADIPLMVI